MSSSSLSLSHCHQLCQSFLSNTMSLTFFLLLLLPAAFAYVPNLLHPQDSALIKLNNYDSTVRPPGLSVPDDPVNVSINFFVRSVESIDHLKNELKIQVTFREEWIDSRLAFSDYSKEVSTNEVQLFWKPDIFFSNEKTGHFHTITKPNTYARLRSNGRVLVSSRISLTLSCPMKLWSFPLDTQSCSLHMPSYGYTTNDLVLQWKGDDPVQVSKTLAIPGFTYEGFDTETCNSITNTGEYSCLLATFKFKRDSFPYIIRVYIPLALLVIASWTSFWLPASAALPRLTVGSITTLTTALLIFREEEFLRLPSLTSLDIWVGVSAFFVFAAFFEFVLVIYQAGVGKVTQSDAEMPGAAKPAKILWITLPEGTTPTDAVAKIGFPVTYLLFHVVCGPILF